MLSQTIYFSLVALTWAFSAFNETFLLSQAEQEEFEPKEEAHASPWTQAQQGVRNAQMPENSTVPSEISILDPNTPNFTQVYPGTQGQNPLPFGQNQTGTQSPTPNLGQVYPGAQGTTIPGQFQQLIQGPIPPEQLRLIFGKYGNASVSFIFYTYVNLLNRGGVSVQPFPFYQSPSTSWPQPPGSLNQSVYPPNQNPHQQPSSTTYGNAYSPNQPWQQFGIVNGNVYPQNQNPSQQPPQNTNEGGYPPNQNPWSLPPQTPNQGGHGYSSYQNPYLTRQQLPQTVNGGGFYSSTPVPYTANRQLIRAAPISKGFEEPLEKPQKFSIPMIADEFPQEHLTEHENSEANDDSEAADEE